jgi:hypothetical protein
MTQINTIFMEETIMRRTIYLVLTAMAVMMLLCGCGSKTETTETNQTTEVEQQEAKNINDDVDDFIDDWSEGIEAMYILEALRQTFGEDFDINEAEDITRNGSEWIIYNNQIVSVEYINDLADNLMQNEM